MKKIMLIAAAAAGLVAMADSVESGVVGYQTTELPKSRYVALAIQFNSLNGSSTIAITNLLSYTNARGATSATMADQLLVYGASGYTTYFYNSSLGNWCKVGESEVTTDTVSVGQAVFFKKASLGTAGSGTISGGVVENDTIQVELPKSRYLFIANPWPVDTPIASIANLYTNPRQAASATMADQILTWSATGYTTYYNKTGIGFVKSGEEDAVTTDVIPAGEGFFFKKASLGTAGVMTFTKPDSL